MVDFCIYEDGKQDYYGQFNSHKELFAYLVTVFPSFRPDDAYSLKDSNEHKAIYYYNNVKIVVIETHRGS